MAASYFAAGRRWTDGDGTVRRALFNWRDRFNDSNYFARQFRKAFGLCPREYRKREIGAGEGLRIAHKGLEERPAASRAGHGSTWTR
ncbi:MAG: hypothetical protein M3463_11975 [Verrucomicrobiota bacterium]|nr:hypothetical protein [Verrucomicrobiota bacterium]